MNKKIKFVILDLETTGLDPVEDKILEVGVALLNEDLVAVDTFESMVTDESVFAKIAELKRDVWEKRDDPETTNQKAFILKMHAKSGLLSDIVASPYYRSLDEVEAMLCDFFHKNGLENTGRADGDSEVHIAGSSLHFDVDFLREHMESIPGYFHHRRLDVSGTKLIVDTWMPQVKKLRDATLKPMKRHRAMDDCIDTATELQWYLENVYGLDANDKIVELALPLDPTVNEVFHGRKIKDAPQA